MSRAIVIPDQIETLPFVQALSWESFQRFCTDLLYRQPNSVDSREYGFKGSSQQGIDVYLVPRGGQKHTVAQCKLTHYLGPQQVIDLVNEFLAGTLVAGTSDFILCTSADLGRQRDEEQTIATARHLLRQQGINFVVWDQRGLSTALRGANPDEVIPIVYRYFGPDVTQAFFGPIWHNYIRKLHPVPKKQYEGTTDYIERSLLSFKDKVSAQDTWSSWATNKQTLVNLFEDGSSGESKKIVLLSTAGFGKTEELNHLAAHFSTPENPVYPFLYRLRDYEGQPIEDLLSTCYHPDWRNLSDAQWLLVFDGLDEIGETHTRSFINHLNAFADSHPALQAVVSARFNFYNIRGNDLRTFDTYLLNPLNHYDIENYLQQKLGPRTEAFKELLKERQFSEFLQNPYYLTRLVRFYAQEKGFLPRNKTALFERILFERLERDEDRFNVSELKSRLLPVARKIAFCMTYANKSTLTDEELTILVPEATTRKDLKLFGIFNRNATALGSWSFEHKNLQEYLCADVLKDRAFTDVQSMVSFTYDRHKLLPRFLNTVSLLFELIDKNSPLFRDLFAWINTNEPELLVRFEREQLDKPTRKAIFESIFYAYKQKGITLRISLNLSNDELAYFVEVDDQVIDFLRAELQFGLPQALAYDAIKIIGAHKRPHMVKHKIENILFNVLQSGHYQAFVKGKAITILQETGLTKKGIFEKILASGINLSHFEIRWACISFLNAVDYSEDFIGFILHSIPIFEKGQKDSIIGGANELLKRLIREARRPASTKKILQWAVDHPDFVSRHHKYRTFQLELPELRSLLQKAAGAVTSDPSIVRVVYRFFGNFPHITLDNAWLQPFKDFFEQTVGLVTIFKKYYRCGKKDRDIMALANEEGCRFLLEEYCLKKFDDKQACIYRNALHWLAPGLFRMFYDGLRILSENRLVIEDIDKDYSEYDRLQEQKNDRFLLNQDLFLGEAATLYDLIEMHHITYTGLWDFSLIDLKPYRRSIVLDAIRNEYTGHEEEVLPREAFWKKYADAKEWKNYVITSVEERLRANNPQPVSSELRAWVEQWCIDRIKALNFEGAITHSQPGSVSCHPHKDYVVRLFLLLLPEVEDDIWLKLLPMDFETFLEHGTGEHTIGGQTMEKVKDKNRLQQTVLANITKGNLAEWVLGSHFKICADLGYRDCLADLYVAITDTNNYRDHERVRLTDYYTRLGGQIADFEAYLSVPDSENESSFAAWHWLLLTEFLPLYPERIIEILLQIINAEEPSDNKIKAGRLLITQGCIEGLNYWRKLLDLQTEIPFEHEWEKLQSGISKMPAVETIVILFDALEFEYTVSRQERTRGLLRLEEYVLIGMLTLAKTDHANFTRSKDILKEWLVRFKEAPFYQSLVYLNERFTYRFYESQSQETDIETANLNFQQFTIGKGSV